MVQHVPSRCVKTVAVQWVSKDGRVQRWVQVAEIHTRAILSGATRSVRRAGAAPLGVFGPLWKTHGSILLGDVIGRKAPS